VNLVIDFTKAGGTTAGVLQSVANSQASAQHVKAVSVPGYGTAAFLYTYGTASSSANGIAASSLDMLAGSEIIDLAGSEPVPQIEAIARYVLKH
jgi:alcohol dehydrogenase YqhD (iron-dependent ADH family)